MPPLADLLRVVTHSRANYRASYAIDLLCPLALAAIGLRDQTPPWPVALASIATGLVIFSFVEYAIHRWCFHGLSGVVSEIHQHHHDAPQAHTALPAPTSVIVATAAWCILAPLIGIATASFLLCGLMAGYFYYGALHHLEHSLRLSALPFRALQRRWAMHAVHHQLPDKNYGVTTSLWDHLFGTHYR
jgi:sterol desaturase/sphingolipid hydroxylase (fatty acid hydroxylase superfamily)